MRKWRCTATNCSTLQHTATALQQHTATTQLCCHDCSLVTLVRRVGQQKLHGDGADAPDVCRNTLQHAAKRCNTVQHTATHCSTLQHTAAHCNTLSNTATTPTLQMSAAAEAPSADCWHAAQGRCAASSQHPASGRWMVPSAGSMTRIVTVASETLPCA